MKDQYRIAAMSNPAVSVAGGIIAGLGAAWAMNTMQMLVPVKAPGNRSHSTVKAANAISKATTGKPVAKVRRKSAGNTAHYAFGAVLGGLYGLTAEIWPRATFAAGIPFGLTVAAVADEIMVPAFGLGAPPWKSPLRLHAYGVASHLVFGMVAETIRNAIRPPPPIPPGIRPHGVTARNQPQGEYS